jgi:hypothetical protein
MFGLPYIRPGQDWKVNPGPAANANDRPVSINSAANMKRGFSQNVLAATSLNDTGSAARQFAARDCGKDYGERRCWSECRYSATTQTAIAA